MTGNRDSPSENAPLVTAGETMIATARKAKIEARDLKMVGWASALADAHRNYGSRLMPI
jgi:hypothetical protein